MIHDKWRELKNTTTLMMVILALSFFLPRIGLSQEEKDIRAYIEKLKSQEEYARLAAAQALVEIGAPAVVLLVHALKVDDFNSRWMAARALGEIKDPRAVEPLIIALKDGDYRVGEGAAEALGKIKDPRAVAPLIDALKDGKWSVPEKAAVALGEIADPRAVEPLMAALKKKNPLIRKEAARTLGKIKDPRAVEALIAVMRHDEETAPRACAAMALGEIKDTRAVKPLIAALKDKDSGGAAAAALGKIKDLRAVKPLLDALKKNDWGAAEALAEIKDPDSIDPLISFLRDKDRNTRSAAVLALGMIRDPRAVEPLIAALKDEDHFVRMGAAEALGKIKDPRAVEPLIAVLKDPSENIRSKAAEALVQIGTPAVGPLVAALTTGGYYRDEMIWALGEIRDPLAVEPIIVRFKKNITDVESRKVVSEALVKIGTPATDPLIAALKDSNHSVRKNVIEILEDIKDIRAIGPLVDCLKDENKDVQKKAESVLCEMGAPVIEFLIATVRGEDANAREYAAGVLVRIGGSMSDCLTAAFQDKNLTSVAWEYSTYISQGEKGSEPLLIASLIEAGNKEMAEAFLNCENPILAEAARVWADRHGYMINPYGVKFYSSWGSKR